MTPAATPAREPIIEVWTKKYPPSIWKDKTEKTRFDKGRPAICDICWE